MDDASSRIAAQDDTQFAAIARFVLDPALAVPDSTLKIAARLLIDTLGVAAGAAALQPARIARDFAADFHGAGTDGMAASMLFDGRRVSLPGAAWALATQIDNLDAHDGLNPTKGHIGCAVVPALFAFAERHPGLDTRTALTTLVMSYEVAARAGMSLHATVSDYHTSGAWNALGVAALGCRLEGSNADTLRHALGIAEYHGPRSQMMREIDNPTMLHDGSGMGALVGASAALMAMRGFTGAPAITAEASGVSDIWADLGRDWTIERNYIKPYPICRWAHAACDALKMVMRRENIPADDIDRVEVRTFTEAARLYPGAPETTSQAQYSLAFALAVMLGKGRIAPRDISGAGLRDPEVLSLLSRIAIKEEPRHSARFPAGRWSDIIVTLRNGRQVASGDVQASGGPEDPMNDDDLHEKFEAMTAQALPRARRDAIWTMRETLCAPGTPFSALADLVNPALEAT